MEDCHKFIGGNPRSPVTEMDTVEGTRGGKVPPTLMFTPYSFMPTFLLDSKTSANMSATFRLIRDGLIGKFGRDARLAIMRGMLVVILPPPISFNNARLKTDDHAAEESVRRATPDAECGSPMEDDQGMGIYFVRQPEKRLARLIKICYTPCVKVQRMIVG